MNHSTTSPDQELTIEVCHGPQCSDIGGRALSEELEANGMKSIIGDCRGQCPNAPLVLVDNRMICNATVEKVRNRIDDIASGAFPSY
ncbi:(2Fe-2S) ferredoxin domain-containing protein [Mariprofundus sp. EBB-1]|uniref:(2Fe-2S) ferredoxin domain-containing protein n=1 Tax=Mariprofundus sp. EBB-1 TaxID=2650971 RepID=UPI000EF28755|nr:(2Fe-2S) ferredoxin domain-containing protein [Mariprofundus sp. EBB-1]RLL54325.1 (2Fe-2S) ferredoxin domain-containing protein [Mariprofundus sp. EBB-1]